MSTTIGSVNTVIGNVEAIGDDGVKRLLMPGSEVFSDDVISTGDASAISIQFLDGSEMDLGRNSQILLDKNVFDIDNSAMDEELPDDIAALQQELLAGNDPTENSEATAAGAGATGGSEGSSSTVIVDYDAPTVDVTSGFQTTDPSDVIPPFIQEDTGNFEESSPVEPPVTTADNIDAVEDNSILIDVLANDSLGNAGGRINSFTQASNGSVELNDDGTFTYNPSLNYSGTDTFSYTLIDDNGSEDTATVTINVSPVADAPILTINAVELIQKAEVITTSNITIDSNNVDTSGNGFSAVATSHSGGPGSISTFYRGPNLSGFGVAGRASGDSKELGGNESLSVTFDQAVNSVDVSFSWLNESESAQYTFFSNGVEVGTATHTGGSDKNDPAMTIKPDNGSSFDQIVFTAPNPQDDYLIHSIEFQVVETKNTFNYQLEVGAQLTDTDGSESLSGVTITGLPTGTSILEAANADGTYNPGKLTLVSDRQLSSDELKVLTGSVTSTDGTDTATTEANADIQFVDSNSILTGSSDSDILSGGLGDDRLSGSAGNDTLSGKSGADTLVGGIGNDTLIGGEGADTFVWQKQDVASPSQDTVIDFNQNEDVLNLADLLSDPSNNYSIEGIDNGNGDLQINIGVKDANGSITTPVQEIELIGININGTADATLQNLLTSGAINDGS